MDQAQALTAADDAANIRRTRTAIESLCMYPGRAGVVCGGEHGPLVASRVPSGTRLDLLNGGHGEHNLPTIRTSRYGC
jgi:hypothetical protein